MATLFCSMVKIITVRKAIKYCSLLVWKAMLVLDRFQFSVLIFASQETAILSWKTCFLRHVMKCTIYSIQSSSNIAHKQYIPTDTLMFFTQQFLICFGFYQIQQKPLHSTKAYFYFTQQFYYSQSIIKLDLSHCNLPIFK